MKKVVLIMIMLCLFLCSCNPQVEPTITIDSAGTETPIITQFHTNRPQKIHFDIRRVELPEKTDDVLLAYYKGDGSDISKVYREDLWGFVNTNGEVIDLSKEQIANSFFPFFENGYKSIYTDDGRSGYMNGKGEIRFIDLAKNEALIDVLSEENGKTYCSIATIEDQWLLSYDRMSVCMWDDFLVISCWNQNTLPNENCFIINLDGTVLFQSVQSSQSHIYMGDGWMACYDGGADVFGALYGLENVCYINLITGEVKEKGYIESICFGEKGQPSAYSDYTEDKGQYASGYLNVCGEEILALQYKSALPFSEDCAVVQYIGEEGFCYIDIDGKKLFDRTFTEAMPFSEGLAAVSFDGEKYGYIDKTGKFVIEPIYFCGALFGLFWEAFEEKSDELGQFHNGYAMVANAEEGWAAYIDKTGKEVFRFSVPVSTEE